MLEETRLDHAISSAITAINYRNAASSGRWTTNRSNANKQ